MTQVRLSSTDFGIADAASPSYLIGASLSTYGTPRNCMNNFKPFMQHLRFGHV